MNHNRENFEKWFKTPLETLYENADAGFPILMISLPLLERYLREVTGIFEGPLNSYFYQTLVARFPTLEIERRAQLFWETYRHGLLHQATLKVKGATIGINNNAAHEIECRNDQEPYSFLVSPIKLSRTVISTIESDFATFEGEGSQRHPMSQVSAEFSGFKPEW